MEKTEDGRYAGLKGKRFEFNAPERRCLAQRTRASVTAPRCTISRSAPQRAPTAVLARDLCDVVRALPELANEDGPHLADPCKP